MPVLANPRHERFAQALAAGKTADEAYQEAGYAENRGNASTLKANQNVQARVAELLEKASEKVEITIATLTDMLLSDRRLARSVKQPSAAISAVAALGKLHGLMIDRKEIRTNRLSELTDDELAAIVAEDTDASRSSTGTPPKTNGSALTH